MKVSLNQMEIIYFFRDLWANSLQNANADVPIKKVGHDQHEQIIQPPPSYILSDISVLLFLSFYLRLGIKLF